MSDRGLTQENACRKSASSRGLHNVSAAELSGLTHSAMRTIEQDSEVRPAISTLQKLLKVYGLSLSDLFRAGKT